MSLEGAQSSTRERLLEAAITLFARQGYEATSIAEIQRACGLAPGSGALYKHFSCKRELLEVATRRYVDRLTEDRKRFDAEPTGNGEQALARAATLIWDGIDDNALLLRVIFREPTFPELAEELWSAITANAYQRFAAGLRAAVDAGAIQIADPEAAAAVLVASLAYYPMVGLLIGHTPGGVDRQRYRAAWIGHAQAVLRQAAHAARRL
ncbi:MAG TPA: TetR/AcrR family transcriptional regulator [Mycobacterium sp.]|nr:TetR/AcrR family transcriptional regulator [Mycobacterium sp.]